MQGEGGDEDEAGAKRSLTKFEVLYRAPAATLVAARPLTGRMHQIRVHAEHAGYPIAGDPQYGAAAQRRAAAEGGAACGRLMLHAHTLTMRHPDSNRTVRSGSSGCNLYYMYWAVAVGIEVCGVRGAALTANSHPDPHPRAQA